MLVGGVGNAPLESYLPSRFVVDKLIAHYWFAVHVVSRAVHRPSFERQYQNFWIRVNMGMEPRSSFQAVLFAALLNSVVSMTEDKVRAEFCVERKIMISNFRAGTETALAKANFLRTTKLETIQAFVMYLVCSIYCRLTTAWCCVYDVAYYHSSLHLAQDRLNANVFTVDPFVPL